MKVLRNLIIIIVIMLGIFFTFNYIKTNKQIVLSFEKELYNLNVGEELQLKPKIEKGKLSGEVNLEYSSSDEAIASFNDGIIIAQAVGEVRVKVFLKNKEKVYAETTIKVHPNKKYDIIYHLDGGQNNSNNLTSYEERSEVDLYEPTKEGYKFLGWFVDYSFSKKIDKITANNTGEINLFAKWEVIKYQINYHLDGGINHLDNKSSFTINDEIILLIPTKEGYIFKGWFLEPNFKTEIISVAKGSKNSIVVYAKWEEKSYTVNYHLNGGVNSSLNKEKLYESDLPFTIINPAREGYIFKGWFLNGDFTTKVTVISTVTTEEINLYAKWEEQIKTYNIIYHLDGGLNHPNNPSLYQESDLPITLLEPVKEGYEFLGWFLKSDFSGENLTQLPIGLTNDVTLYAKWQIIITYQVNYVLDGGINHPNNPHFFTKIDLPMTLKSPTKDGFIFMGWYKEADFSGEKVESILVEPASDITLYAFFMSASEYHARIALEFAEYSQLAVDVSYARDMIDLIVESSIKDELTQRLLAIEVIEDDVIRDDSTIID